VLFVLDYKNLHTKAEEEINREVQKIIELRGKENLFVLVNKIDERKNDKKSLNSEQVKSFVTSKFGVKQQNIFEISALDAFEANSFLQESTNSQEFGQKIYKNRWQRLQSTITKDELQQDARQMWDESGFSAFLNNVIHKLTTGSTHECMRTAIRTTHNCITQRLPV
jgi:GTPase involved in cell partitioning and DNA repair